MDDFNHFDAAALLVERLGSEFVRTGALQVEGWAKLNIQANHQIDTGFMLNSVYTVTSTEDGANAAQAAAEASHAASGTGGEAPRFLRDEERPATTTEAHVVVGAEYGVYQELGTVKQPARPFMAPAAERVRPSYEAAWRALEARLRAAGLGV